MPIKKTLIWTLIAGVVVAGAAFSRLHSRRPAHSEATSRQATTPTAAPRPARGSGPVSVRATIATPQVLQERITLPASILPDEAVDLRSETSGRVEKILFTEGGAVRAGALLVKINDSDLQAQRKKAIATRDLASQRLERQRRLYDQQMVSADLFETISRELAAAQADVELIDAQIAKTEIRAPFNGVAGLRHISTGAYVNNGTLIADFVATRPVKIECALPQRFVDIVKPGTPFTLVTTNSSRTLPATVYAVEPSLNVTTRTIRIRGRSPAADSLIVPGSFARAEFQVRFRDDAIIVPSVSIVPDAHGEKVFVIREGALTVRRITSGLRTESGVEITEGLAPGDTVITDGAALVRPKGAFTLIGIE